MLLSTKQISEIKVENGKWEHLHKEFWNPKFFAVQYIDLRPPNPNSLLKILSRDRVKINTKMLDFSI